MDTWQIASNIIAGLAVGQYVVYLKKRDGLEDVDYRLWLRILVYVVVIVFVLGYGTNLLIPDMENRLIVRTLFWFGLFGFFGWKTTKLPPARKPD